MEGKGRRKTRSCERFVVSTTPVCGMVGGVPGMGQTQSDPLVLISVLFS